VGQCWLMLLDWRILHSFIPWDEHTSVLALRRRPSAHQHRAFAKTSVPHALLSSNPAAREFQQSPSPARHRSTLPPACLPPKKRAMLSIRVASRRRLRAINLYDGFVAGEWPSRHHEATNGFEPRSSCLRRQGCKASWPHPHSCNVAIEVAGVREVARRRPSVSGRRPCRAPRPNSQSTGGNIFKEREGTLISGASLP